MERIRLIKLLKLIKYNKCPDVVCCVDGCILAEKYQPCVKNSDDTRNRAIEMMQEELMSGGENSTKSTSNCNTPLVISPVCSICGGKGSYSYGGSFGGSVSTVRCNCGANDLY